MSSLHLVLLILATLRGVCSTAVDVEIENGTVRGYPVTIEGNQVFQFLGIPFAEPPLGSLRLRPSIPVGEKWSSPLIADKPPHGCLQTPDEYFPWPDHLRPRYSEDCLYLSVWTPAVGEGQRKSVMFYIHGGGFSNGEALPVYTGLALSALGDVVVVSIQYRLGFLGFARLDDEIVPGNLGMLDQQRALRWVQENIAQFGGDPNKVTIFGESAGASSVSLHLMNDESGRMFQRAILQSGTSLHVWGFYPDNVALEAMYRNRAARDLGCPQTNTEELLKCLQSKTSDEFLASFYAYNKRRKFATMLGANVDGSFMNITPREAMKRGKVQVKETMIGMTSDESGLVLNFLSEQWRNMKNISDPSDAHMTPEYVAWAVDQAVPHFPYFATPVSEIARKVLIEQALSHNQSDPSANGRRLLDLINGNIMDCDVNNFADYMSYRAPRVFFYLLSKKSPFNMWPMPTFPWITACHGDELPYVFGHPLVYPHLAARMTEEDKELSRRMIADFTTFAKTGRPRDLNWRPYTMAKQEYYNYNYVSRLEKGGVKRDVCLFWNRLMPILNEATCSLDKDGRCSLSGTSEEGNDTSKQRDEL